MNQEASGELHPHHMLCLKRGRFNAYIPRLGCNVPGQFDGESDFVSSVHLWRSVFSQCAVQFGAKPGASPDVRTNGTNQSRFENSGVSIDDIKACRFEMIVGRRRNYMQECS